MLVKDGKADHIRRQQVGSKLDTLENAIERAGERVGQRRFAHPRNVLDEQVTTGNQRHYRESNRFRLTLDDGFDSLLEPFDLLDRVGAGYLFAADWLEVPHELA